MKIPSKQCDRLFYDGLIRESLAGTVFPYETCQQILTSPKIELISLLEAAFAVRKAFFGKVVQVHVINNAQNGFCPEDCHYCPQAKSSEADIEEYPLKSEEEILAEAKNAYESGAFRYCMVFAGRGPSPKRIDQLTGLIKSIKEKYPIRLCVSAGLITKDAAKRLKDAGLDTLNHNLNTSQRFYPNICTTHTFADRLNTLRAAKEVGLEICSGLIVGMGEEARDIIEVALQLRELNSPSIPVNFLIPIEGNKLSEARDLTPEYCLRVLCLFRFLNPKAEIRVAAGREGHLRSLEVMSLYPANSLFMDGYLNTKGSSKAKVLRMIKDAGFTIDSEYPIDEILERDQKNDKIFSVDDNRTILKGLKELRPQLQAQPEKRV